MTVDAAGSFQRTVETDVEGEGTLLAGLYPYNDGIVGLRSKTCATIGHTVEGILGGGESCPEVQLSAVATGVVLAVESQFYTSYRQEAHAVGPLDEILVDEGMSLFLLAFEYQLPYLLQMSLRLRAIIIIR